MMMRSEPQYKKVVGMGSKASHFHVAPLPVNARQTATQNQIALRKSDAKTASPTASAEESRSQIEAQVGHETCVGMSEGQSS